MSYDQDRVDFSQEEHDAAKNLDEIYEKLHELLADGADVSDLAQLPALFGPSVKLYKYLTSDDRAEFASKLIALAVALERDNSFL